MEVTVMARKFGDLRKGMKPESRVRAEQRTEEMLREMPLVELRRARALTQAQLAELLHMSQPAVCNMERQTDMYISTLRRMIEAMGGRLEVRAQFPEGSVQIDQFDQKNCDQSTVG
jgi:hypothetical protein